MSAILHTAKIISIENDNIKLSLTNEVHCEACQLKSNCNSGISNSKIFTSKKPEFEIKLNEEVYIVLNDNQAITAILFSYIIPFIILLTTLILSSIYFQEWVVGILVLVFLTFYFLILSQLRDRIEKLVSLKILKK